MFIPLLELLLMLASLSKCFSCKTDLQELALVLCASGLSGLARQFQLLM